MPLMMLCHRIELARLVFLEYRRRKPLALLELGKECCQHGILLGRDGRPHDPFHIGFLRDDLQVSNASVLFESQHRAAFGEIIAAARHEAGIGNAFRQGFEKLPAIGKSVDGG